MVDQAKYRMKVVSSHLTRLLGKVQKHVVLSMPQSLVFHAFGRPCLFAQAALVLRSRWQNLLSIDSTHVYVGCLMFCSACSIYVCHGPLKRKRHKQYSCPSGPLKISQEKWCPFARRWLLGHARPANNFYPSPSYLLTSLLIGW